MGKAANLCFQYVMLIITYNPLNEIKFTEGKLLARNFTQERKLIFFGLSC